MTFGPINTQSSYLPTEFDMPPDDGIMREIITQRERLTASILNLKENANYEKREILSAQQWFMTTAPTVNSPDKKRYGYRTTIDLVALNGGPIGAGATTLTLTSSTIPPAIMGYTIPLPSHGSATAADGTSIFLNDPAVYVRFVASSNQITITNSYGANLTQCYFSLEYLKQ